MKIFSGNSNRKLAGSIASYLGIELGAADVVSFPDGESFVKINECVRGEDCYAVQSVCGKPNEMLMELLIMIDALRRASAARITAVLPIYGYARQDRKDQPRVPITAKLVANLLTAAGADRVLTMDLHAAQIVGYFDIPVDHLHAFPVIVKYLKDKNLKNPVIVAPDTGSVKNAYSYSRMFGCGLAIVAKQRKGADEVEAFSLVGDVNGCDVIMIDDLTSTCGTLCAAANLVKKHGANNVYAAVTHGLLNDQGRERLSNSSISELIVTDTVPQNHAPELPITVLSVADLFGEAIRRINEDSSIGTMFSM
ncbi:MAG: ribose-phosphate pyrophosphokinase [Kiritimatiellae bacterium]|nr:ribose-phosphate pyrophosphokinase [Kiritimatiellia bacterium]MBQ2281176.1 ribose-phosphate pyrophosphokinase [Kiritimatiellia bacterium]